MFTLLSLFIMLLVFAILTGILVGIFLLLIWLLKKLLSHAGSPADEPPAGEERGHSHPAGFIFSVLLSGFFLLLSWGMLSYLGAIPSYMSMPMKSHYLNQILVATTTDVQEEFRKTLDAESIPKGTFDELNETSRHQASLRHYMENKNTLLFVPSGKDRAYSLKNGELKGLWKAGRQMGLLVSEKGLDYFISCKYRGQTTVDHASRSADSVTYYEGVQRTTEGFVPEYLADLLNRQKTGNITPREFACLLEARLWGQLAGWFPETDTAFIFDGSEKGLLRAYNTADGTYQETQIPQDYELIGFVNDRTAACIRPGGSISMCDIDEGELKDTVAGMHAVRAGIWVDDETGDVYLSAVHTKEDGSSPFLSGWHWTDGSLKPVAETLWYHELEEDWNWQEADVLCQKDIAFAVFPDKTFIQYVKFDDPWE